MLKITKSFHNTRESDDVLPFLLLLLRFFVSFFAFQFSLAQLYLSVFSPQFELLPFSSPVFYESEY